MGIFTCKFVFVVFFFKQKTAYEMSLRDWSSDVCSSDLQQQKAVNRRTLTRYLLLPNYRNYWKEAGYVDEMKAIETAIDEGREEDLPGLMSDRWLADATLFGSASAVRDGVMAWREAGISTPILVP